MEKSSSENASAPANEEQVQDPPEGSVEKMLLEVREVGYKLCSSIEETRLHFNALKMQEVTPDRVARILMLMVATHTGLKSTKDFVGTKSYLVKKKPSPPANAGAWGANAKDKLGAGSKEPTAWNIDVFVQVLKELNPTLSWIEVIRELDHPDLAVGDRTGLTLLMNICKLGIQYQGLHPINFPIDLFYRKWRNVKPHLQLISLILRNQDVFSFADYNYRSIVAENLKVNPELETKEVLTWRSLELIELLVSFADRGIVSPIQEILKFPVQNCPDVLMLGLIQMPQPMSSFRQELISSLMPLFLSNHPNSHAILHSAWHSQQNLVVKQIILHSVPDWCMRGGDGDPGRLSRVFDIIKDLKDNVALSHLLSTQIYPFVLDLACLASRREFLNLEKWITDKIRDHGDSFVKALITFLQKRCPQLTGMQLSKEEHPKSIHLPLDTAYNILTCLQANSVMLSPDSMDAVHLFLSNYNILLMNKGLAMQVANRTGGAVVPSRGLGLPPFNRTANTLFTPTGNHQLDQITGLANLTANLSLIGGPSQLGVGGNGMNMPGGGLSSLGGAGNPGSPSRLLGPQNTFSMLPQLNRQPPPSAVSAAQQSLLNTVAAGNLSTAVSSIAARLAAASQVSERSRSIVGGANDVIPLPSELTRKLSKEIEDEAFNFFTRIYNHERNVQTVLSPEDALELLKRLHDSPVQHDQDLFVCMVRNLFDEYKFFHQYPDQEIHITAKLFAGILSQGFLANTTLFNLGLRCILEALRKPPTNRLRLFGLYTLEYFKYKFKDIPKFCELLLSCCNISDIPSNTVEYIEYGARSMEPPSSRPMAPASSRVTTPTKNTAVPGPGLSLVSSPSANRLPSSSRPSIANATNIDTLLIAMKMDDSVVIPPESTQDKISFIFNNLSQLNLTLKCDELRDLLDEDYYIWMAQYMVMRRASIEQNFHPLYANFLDGLKLSGLNKCIESETYRNIKVLLRSDKSVANFSDRTLLKNLGHWLGLLTLAKDKPLHTESICLEMLLIEAHRNGPQELLYVVPFVSKVLEATGKSKIFQYPNSWTLGVLYLLYEIHIEQELKLNLKFEIEVLCKNLHVDLMDLKHDPNVYLKNGYHADNLISQLASDKKDTAAAGDAPTPPVTSATTTTSVATTSTSQPVTSVATSSARTTPSDTSPIVTSQAQEPSPSPLPVPPAPTTPVTQPAAATTSSDTTTTTATEEVPQDASNNSASTSATTPPRPQPAPLEPKYNILTFNLVTVQQVCNHLVINLQYPVFQLQPNLASLVKTSVENVIVDWVGSIMDRSVKTAVTTTEQLVKKDWAMDGDCDKMRSAAHYMVRNLSASYTLASCRETILVQLISHIKASFAMAILNPTPQQKEGIEVSAKSVAEDNIELVLVFIQKAAIEKSTLEVDKKLMEEIEKRKAARADPNGFQPDVDIRSMAIAERVPQVIDMKMNSSKTEYFVVYEEFSRHIPGFQTLTDQEVATLCSMKNLTQLTTNHTDEALLLYEKLSSDLEQYLQRIASTSGATTNFGKTHAIMEALHTFRRTREHVSLMTALQMAVEGILEEPESLVLREFYLRIFKTFQDPKSYGVAWTNKQITKVLWESKEELRLNLTGVDVLLREHLLNMQVFDQMLTQNMDSGNHKLTVNFAMQLTKKYVIDEHGALVTDLDLPATIEQLTRISNNSTPPPEGLASLVNALKFPRRQPFAAQEKEADREIAHLHSSIYSVRGQQTSDDKSAICKKNEQLLTCWIKIYNQREHSRDRSKIFSQYVSQLSNHGILKTDDNITKFFQDCTKLVVRAVQNHEPRTAAFPTIDAFSTMISMLVKFSGTGSTTDIDPNATKLRLLNKILGIIAGIMLEEQGSDSSIMIPLPYLRIFSLLFRLMAEPDPALEPISVQITQAFSHAYHILRPSRVPSFSYCWLELIGHRTYLGKMLTMPNQKGWSMYAQLLIDLMKFMAPFLRNAKIPKAVSVMYRATLRILLILLHDYPEFLCDYHYGFCDVIPPNCVQIRNVILSAFPRNMRLPDPFTSNMKVETLANITLSPRIGPNIMIVINETDTLKDDLDGYMSNRSPPEFLTGLRARLQACTSPGTKYNIPLLNSVVLYVGSQAISHIHGRGLTTGMATIGQMAHMDIFHTLINELDTEGRYLLINAMANQLRFPNNQTHYFSTLLLYLFAESPNEPVKEQITRCLLERIIVNRPHPWGLLITFIELLKNPRYDFWAYDFTRCAPEIHKLLESVARSCLNDDTPPGGSPAVSETTETPTTSAS